MKVRLTESQYNDLLKVINPNKKLIITESQYKRLILEGSSQLEFNQIKGGELIKIKASNKDFIFEVISADDARLLLKNTNDGRYVNVYFFLDFNAIDNNQLATKISKAKAGPYSKITPNLIKDTESWKTFTFKNVTSFQVFKDKSATDLLLNIDTKTGKEIKQQNNDVDDDGPMDVDTDREIRDNLIKGIEPNTSYKITFFDKSTLKFFVTEKNGSVIDIKFKTKSEKADMSYDDMFNKNAEDRGEFFDGQNKIINSLTSKVKEINTWLSNHDRTINKLTDKLNNSSTNDERVANQAALDKANANKDKYTEIAKKYSEDIQKAQDLKDKYWDRGPRYQGVNTISTTDYTDGFASRWVKTIEESPEYEHSKGLKIDLSNIKIHRGKLKVQNKKQEDEIAKLNKQLSSATDEVEKKRIEDRLKEINRANVLFFQNKEFDVYTKSFNRPTDNFSAFDLLVTLMYRPVDGNPDSKLYSKNFPLKGIINLTIIKDDKGPSLTDKREVTRRERYNMPKLKVDYKYIQDYIKNNTNAKAIINSKPSVLMRLLGAKSKGMLPLEKLQSELGNVDTSKNPSDKFIAGRYVTMKPNFTTVKEVKDDAKLNEFKRLMINAGSDVVKALVKRYTLGDEHVALTMKHEESGVMYTFFVQEKEELPEDEELGNNEYYVELKYNNNKNQAKKSIAKFKVKVINYDAPKL